MKQIDANCIEQVSQVLGDLVTGTEITKFLTRLDMIDHDTQFAQQPGYQIISTKRIRLQNSIIEEIQNKKSYFPFFKLIEAIMNPTRFGAQRLEPWKATRDELNFILRFYGYEINDAGVIEQTKATQTFSEGISRSQSLFAKLESQNIHPEILKYCKPELLENNYFHAILEASKSLFQRLRNLTGSSLDGNTLVNDLFKLKDPAVLLNGNNLSTDDERNEFLGLKSLLNTICYFYRNPTAHSPKIYNIKSEGDAINALKLISLAHMQLDRCFAIKHFT